MHRSTVAWVVLLGAVLGSLILSYSRLERLPDFPALVGPDMIVRLIKSSAHAGKKNVRLEPDDKLVAIQSRGVEDLRDLHAVLSHLDYAALSKVSADVKTDEMTVDVTYQTVRPLHRFNVLLQGDSVEPSGLPPGVEPTDLLVELDGRPLQPAIGPEGLRSIISSRPEASLVFERKNAVFTGNLSLPIPQPPRAVLLMFVMTLFVVLALWRMHHESVSWQTALAVGFETLAFSWLSVLIFQYQWLLADFTLAYVSIVSIVLMRPFGIMARTLTAQGPGSQAGGSVLLGIISSALICVFLSRGMLVSVEQALQLAVLLVAFFVVFEVVLTGLNDESGKLLGERSIYLAGIILFVFLACLLSWGMDEQAFREDRWRWFACIVLALVWFGDVLLCFRGVPDSQFGELAEEVERHVILWHFLEELQEVYPGLDVSLLFHRDNMAFRVRRKTDGLNIEACDTAMLDAISILVHENARVPLSVLEDGESNPMSGMAQSMGIEIAFVMSPPRQAIETGHCAVTFVATRRAEEPLQLTLGDEDLDFIQSRMTALIWSAATIESLSLFVHATNNAPQSITKKATEVDTEALEAAQLKVERLQQEHQELLEQHTAMRRWYNPAPLLPMGADRLIEAELIGALAYLFEDNDAIVLAGDHGVGKKFVAQVAHKLDEQRQLMPCIIYDASNHEEEDYSAHFASTETTASPLMQVCVGGSLIVDHAEFLTSEVLHILLEEAEAASVQLYLCYVSAQAQSRSVLLSLDDTLFERLESREMVIPSFANRKSIQRAVLLHLLDDATYNHHKAIDNMSSSAMKSLLGYSYPGQILEARMVLDLAVRRCQTPSLEISALPMEIRRAHSSF